MADVTIKYKGSTIAEMSETESKTLTTSGTYCEDNIEINYAPRCKTYEITLPQIYGNILLTTLDDEVLSHINDDNLTVSLIRVSPHSYDWYSGSAFFGTNRIFGYYQDRAEYGYANRMVSEVNNQINGMFVPANNTSLNLSSTAKYGLGSFAINDGKYYVMPTDGYIAPGTYHLTFTW